MERPKPRPSEAPKLSISTTWGICLHSPALTSLLHITPDETMVTRLLVSQRPGFSSSACSIGLANASPTIAMLCTLCLSTVSHNSVASKDGSASVTMAPRSEEHTSELQSLMRNSYAVFCLKKTTKTCYV